MTTTNRRLLIAASRPVNLLRKFTFDRTAGDANISTCTALIKRLRGNTIVWNQLVQNGNFADGKNNWGSNGTVSNNVLTFTGTTQWICPYNRLSSKIVSGHIVYLSFRAYTTSDSTTLNIKPHLATSGSTWENTLFDTQNPFYLTNSIKRFSVIKTLGNDGEYLKMLARDGNTGALDNQPICLTDVQVFDLTQMFGAGNEPTSVAEFESMFPLDYYEYNAGELLSFNGDSIKAVGLNQLDEEWEVGSINLNTGNNVSNTKRIRSKNYTPVLPNTNYSGIVLFTSKYVNYFFYDANYNYIEYHGKALNGVNSFITPANSRYARFLLQENYGTTYRHDICINISDLSKNGTYEPYIVNTKDISFYKSIKDGQGNTLFPYGLLSAGSVYDEVTENKAIKRVGVVDLGDCIIAYSNESGHSRFGVQDIYSTIKPSGYIICSKYPQKEVLPSQSSYPDETKVITVTGNNSSSARCWIWDDDYTTAADFKTAMNGVMLYYELAEPIEVDIEEQNLEYPAYRTGTEELLPTNGAVPTTTPALFDIRYKIGGRRN